MPKVLISDRDRLLESFARHLMVSLDAWQQDGFGEVARSYLSRLAPKKGVRRTSTAMAIF